jgi:hypothetical protein
VLRISKTALAKWAGRDLSVERQPDGSVFCRFQYEGSSCNNGGTPFQSTIRAVLLSEGDDKWRIADAQVELDRDDPAWDTFCSYRQNPSMGRSISTDGSPAIGMDLDEFIEGEWSTNNAGCYCSMAHVNHKLLLAMNTLRWWLTENSSS